MLSLHFKRHPFLAFTVAVAFVVFVAKYIGFCWARMRVVADRENIEAAVARMLPSGRIAVRDPQNEHWWYLIADMPKFETAEAFLKAYPECCHVRAVASGEHAMTREIVVVRFPVQYAGYGGVERTGNVKTEFAVTPCGRVVTASSD